MHRTVKIQYQLININAFQFRSEMLILFAFVHQGIFCYKNFHFFFQNKRLLVVNFVFPKLKK